MSDIKKQIGDLPKCRDCSAAEVEANALLNGDVALAIGQLDQLEAAGCDVREERSDVFFQLGHMAVSVLGAGPDNRTSALGDNLLGGISMAIGNRAMQQKWTSNGIGWLNQSIALDPAPEAYYNLGLLLAGAGRTAEAIDAFQPVTNCEDPDLRMEAIKAVQRLQRGSGGVTSPAVGQPAGPQAAGGVMTQKSKMTAGILGILLGGLGVHRFYLGYNTIGIIQIVVTVVTCGFGALWGLVEGILILTGTIDKDASGIPLTS